MPTTQTLTELDKSLAAIHTETGATLLSLAESSPILLIFLRHFGCAFCRQAISDVADLSNHLAAQNVRPVFVHLGTPERAKPFFDYYHLETVERISDPTAELYRQPPFDLSRQPLIRQFFSPKVWFAWLSGAIFKHGVGKVQEDANQMPGIFFLKNRKIARTFRYKTIADQPDYRRLIA